MSAFNQHIDFDKKVGGEFYEQLRCQKPYCKRNYVNQDRCGQLTQRLAISYRSCIVKKHERFSDYGGYAMIGGLQGRISYSENSLKHLHRDF